jgi:hypothetical protein
MPSRLEELKDLRDMVRENEGVATSIDLSELEDLLAVVEAARKRVKVGGHRAGWGCYEASFAKGVKGCPCGLDDLSESIAKLDEEDSDA